MNDSDWEKRPLVSPECPACGSREQHYDPTIDDYLCRNCYWPELSA